MEHEDYSDPKWIPEPPDAGPSQYINYQLSIRQPHLVFLEFRTLRPTDLISTLVSIYDSHELFIKELQNRFSSLLLRNREGTFDAEVWLLVDALILYLMATQKRQIEILKLRFGDAALQSVDVMLFDMLSSVRINKQMYDGKEVSLLGPSMSWTLISTGGNEACHSFEVVLAITSGDGQLKNAWTICKVWKLLVLPFILIAF